MLEAGLEPAQPQWPRDFKSLVSTIPPFERVDYAKLALFRELHKSFLTQYFFFCLKAMSGKHQLTDVGVFVDAVVAQQPRLQTPGGLISGA